MISGFKPICTGTFALPRLQPVKKKKKRACIEPLASPPGDLAALPWLPGMPAACRTSQTLRDSSEVDFDLSIEAGCAQRGTHGRTASHALWLCGAAENGLKFKA